MPRTHIPNPHKLRALVLHGDRPTADALGELFTLCGGEALVAYDGGVACVLARANRPDVVLVDLRGHGLEVARQLRQQPELNDTALVAVTAPGEEEAARRASEEHDFAHYLVEPVDPAQVQALLKKLKTPK